MEGLDAQPAELPAPQAEGRGKRRGRRRDAAGPAVDATYKVLLLGDSGVGKTALIRALMRNQFNASHLTTVGQYATTQATLNRLGVLTERGEKKSERKSKKKRVSPRKKKNTELLKWKI